MPYCNQCGNELKGNEQFCGKCGARQGEQTTEKPSAVKKATAPPVPPSQTLKPVNQYAPPPKSGKGIWKIIVMAVLAAGLITVGVLYGIENSNLNQAKADIAELENNVATLQTELAAEQANAASLQTQLTATINDLNASRDEVAQLEDDLSASEQRVANLEAELDAANAELAQAYADIAALTADNAALSEELNMVKDPRHFNSLDELETWLENDDTDTNSAYSSLTPQARAYVLQVKALRDGYLLSACIDWDSNYIYSWNIAIIGKAVYSINAESDAITAGPSFYSEMPLHPLPLS
jgi:peptidoglycan hydrolase CwlO-like protein